MANRPENPSAIAGGLHPIGQGADQTSGNLLSSDPLALPLVDYRLISVPAEAEKRERFLSAVRVDENGVAHAVNPASLQETLLAAVRVDDDKNATQVPLTVSESGILLFELPSNKPSRIGFFVGYQTSQDVAGVLRMGLYPGVPLTTQSINDKQMAEVMYGMKGFNSSETDEANWAEQVQLFGKLGFNPMRSKGMFNKNHKPSALSNTWKVRPLVVAPDDVRRDMLTHYSEDDVRKDEFQILFYGTRPVIDISSFHDSDTLGLSLGSMRGAPASFGMQTKGIGIGFGEAQSKQATTRGVDISSLEGAFKIIVVPASI